MSNSKRILNLKQKIKSTSVAFDKNRFQSSMRNLADHVHSKGLKFGICCKGASTYDVR